MSYVIEAIKSPRVFITGMPRSGTTLLGMMLNAHTELAICPETKYFSRHWRSCGESRCLQNDETYRVFIEGLMLSHEFQHLGFSEDEASELKKFLLAMREPEHDRILGQILTSYRAKQGKNEVGEKTPGHHPFIPLIHEYFPEARFVYIERDPRAVSFSLQGMPWRNGNTFNHAIRWNWYHRLSNRYLDEKIPIRRISYERLVTDPETEIKEICRFLSIDYESAMVHDYHRGDPIFDAADEPWKARTLQPIDPTRIDRWCGEMKRSELLVVEVFTKLRSLEVGYEKTATAAGLFDFLQAALIVFQGVFIEITKFKGTNIFSRIKLLMKGGQRGGVE